MAIENSADRGDPFKTCNVCKTSWISRDQFLDDPEVRLIGYQPDFSILELGYLLFNHDKCNNTLAMHVKKFKSLHEGEIFTEMKHGSEDCKSYCLEESNLDVCPVKCKCRYVRDLMQVLKK